MLCKPCQHTSGLTGWKIVMAPTSTRKRISLLQAQAGLSFCAALKSNDGYLCVLWAPNKFAEFVVPNPYPHHTGWSAACWPSKPYT